MGTPRRPFGGISGFFFSSNLKQLFSPPEELVKISFLSFACVLGRLWRPLKLSFLHGGNARPAPACGREWGARAPGHLLSLPHRHGLAFRENRGVFISHVRAPSAEGCPALLGLLEQGITQYHTCGFRGVVAGNLGKGFSRQTPALLPALPNRELQGVPMCP